MNSYHKFRSFIILCTILSQTLSIKPYFENIYSKLFSKQIEETVQKELTLNKNGTLSIENIHGNINIKTEWKQNSIILKATKRISKKENPKNTIIKIDKQISKNKIFITTESKDDKCKPTVNYELIIPNNITVHLKTDNGDIKIQKTRGPISAITNNGNIKIVEAKGKISAITKNGNISIEQTQENVTAKAVYGNIDIINSSKSVQAKTDSGNIKVACKTIGSLSNIDLDTKKGNISVCLPNSTNADLKACTTKGKVTSEHLITIKPQTVTLDKQTWTRFKREVDGTLGSGEATIKLSSNYGNIKIKKNKA